MMPTQAVLRWLDGRGWLVLSGSDQITTDVRGMALGRAAADGGGACLSLTGDPADADRLLDDIDDLGAPSTYIVDIYNDDDVTLQRRLEEASVIIITNGTSADQVRSALKGAAIDGIQAAYEHGAVVLAEGVCAVALGEWLMLPTDDIISGLEWLHGALIEVDTPDVALYARPLFLVQPSAIAVGIGGGSALVLGPDGQVETWGLGQVTIALGPTFTG
ncbi:MAG: hypothetical protein GYB67_03130 [Chloroflexi bacterium]|nr:hypothetical protein [Chloroflexota bacterium]